VIHLLIMLTGGNDISELQPPTGLLFIPNVIYEYGTPWWNDTNREKLKNSEKTCPSVTLSITNVTKTDMRAKQGLRGSDPFTGNISTGHISTMLHLPHVSNFRTVAMF
jgi:hypothetical protein